MVECLKDKHATFVFGTERCDTAALINAIKHGPECLEKDSEGKIRIKEEFKDDAKQSFGIGPDNLIGSTVVVNLSDHHVLVDTSGFNDSDPEGEFASFTAVQQAINNVKSFDMVLLFNFHDLIEGRD